MTNAPVCRDCPFCLAGFCRPVFPGKAIPTNSPISTEDLGLVRCGKCDTIYVNPAPAPEALLSYYPPLYYKGDQWTVPGAFKQISRLHSFLHGEIRLWLSQTNGSTVRRVLEVGCANGDNLEPFVKAGWHAYAVEPNPRLASTASKKGIKTHTGFIDSMKWDGKPFDLVILNHVLEHDYDPRNLLKKCTDMLRPGGTLYVEAPIAENLSWIVCGRFWGGLEFPFHLTLLRKDQILTLVREAGCVPVKVKKMALLGDFLRALENRFPSAKQALGLPRFVFTLTYVAIQGTFTVLDAILGQGEALSVVAIREPSSGDQKP